MRAARRVGATIAATVLAAGCVLAGAGTAAAQPTVLYAAVGGTGGCSSPADACDLTTALEDVNAGEVIQLITPGGSTGSSRYVGNWTVSTSGTSAGQPVTIEAAPGLASQPILDGDNFYTAPGGETCSTASCDGPVLTVGQGEYVVLAGITIGNGHNTTGSAGGGGLDNAGTVTITGAAFINDYAEDGGAIDNGDGYNGGTVSVTGSTFAGNNALDGGAIDSGDNGGGGSVTVTASTFHDNSVGLGDGGAIDSGDNGGAGTVTVTASTFTGSIAAVDGNIAADGGAIDSGDNGGAGTVTVTASTFTGNQGSFDGGAIDSGQNGGAGTVTVTASTFSGNLGNSQGGAIDSGDDGGGSVTVTASTFTGNYTDQGGDGGAIDSGDNDGGPYGGGGSVTVTASTFTGNYTDQGGDGGTIDSGDNGGGGSVTVTADLFAGSCDQPGGTWTDEGYNAGTDSSCFAASNSPASDTSSTAVGSDLQSGPTSNGGPTQTIAPTTGNPAIELIPDPTSVSVGGSQAQMCPAVDQRGYASYPTVACDAGAVQTSGVPPSLSLADTASTPGPGGYRRAGDTIGYSYRVTNTGNAAVSQISISDPLLSYISCPVGTLAPSTSETCTGLYHVTDQDLTDGQVTDTATAQGVTPVGTAVTSDSSTVTVQEGWPQQVAGVTRPAAGSGPGYVLGVTGTYLGSAGARWTLLVTSPAGGTTSFTGSVTVPAGPGRLANLTVHGLGRTDSVTARRKVITFSLPDPGRVLGFTFTTSAKVSQVTFTLDIGGQPATARQVSQGSPASFAPVTNGQISYTR